MSTQQSNPVLLATSYIKLLISFMMMFTVVAVCLSGRGVEGCLFFLLWEEVLSDLWEELLKAKIQPTLKSVIAHDSLVCSHHNDAAKLSSHWSRNVFSLLESKFSFVGFLCACLSCHNFFELSLTFRNELLNQVQIFLVAIDKKFRLQQLNHALL